MQLSKYLGQATGIQYGGVQDQSEVMQGNAGFAGLIVGEFKHGRLNQPFLVTKSTIKARLGYQPDNPHYQAVQDALDMGLPSVWVMRVAAINGGGGVVVPPDNGLPPAHLETRLASLVIEGFYVEDTDLPYLNVEYSNLYGVNGHRCSRARFAAVINGLIVGDINMNNDLGGSFPRDDEYNTIEAISSRQIGTYSRYSRIDISEEQASGLAELNNSNIEFTLAPRWDFPHDGITWIRFSLRQADGTLHKLYDQTYYLGQRYSFDILQPELGITNTTSNPVYAPNGILTYLHPIRAKWSGNGFTALYDGINVLVNPSESNTVEFEVCVVDASLNDGLLVEYSLETPFPDMHLSGNILTIDVGADFSNRNVRLTVDVSNPADPVNDLSRQVSFNLSSMALDLSASVLYKSNDIWQAIETGNTIPYGLLYHKYDVTEVILNDKVTSTLGNCFGGEDIANIKLSKNLTTVGKDSFPLLNRVRKLELPDGFTTFTGTGCFGNLGKGLSDNPNPETGCYFTELILPSTLTDIAYSAFTDWQPLTEPYDKYNAVVDLRDTNLQRINTSFMSVGRSHGVRIKLLFPDSLERIEGESFENSYIKELRLGRNIQYVSRRAFREAYAVRAAVDLGGGNFTYPDLAIPVITILREDAVLEPETPDPLGGLEFNEYRKLHVPHNLLDAYKSSSIWSSIVSPSMMSGIDPNDFD